LFIYFLPLNERCLERDGFGNAHAAGDPEEIEDFRRGTKSLQQFGLFQKRGGLSEVEAYCGA